LAEQLRWISMCHAAGVPFGASRPVDGLASESWAEWHARRTAREVAILNGSFGPAEIAAAARTLANSYVAPQLHYHERAAGNADLIEARLSFIARACFAGTLVAGFAYLSALALQSEAFKIVERLSTGVFSMLPAIGAAVAAVRSQADLVRTSARSRALVAELQPIFIALRDPRITFDKFSRALRRAWSLMEHEAREWKAAAAHKAPQPRSRQDKRRRLAAILRGQHEG
jgi:hypothetical protein